MDKPLPRPPGLPTPGPPAGHLTLTPRVRPVGTPGAERPQARPLPPWLRACCVPGLLRTVTLALGGGGGQCGVGAQGAAGRAASWGGVPTALVQLPTWPFADRWPDCPTRALRDHSMEPLGPYQILGSREHFVLSGQHRVQLPSPGAPPPALPNLGQSSQSGTHWSCSAGPRWCGWACCWPSACGLMAAGGVTDGAG